MYIHMYKMISKIYMNELPGLITPDIPWYRSPNNFCMHQGDNPAYVDKRIRYVGPLYLHAFLHLSQTQLLT